MQGLRVTRNGETRMIWGPTARQQPPEWRQAFYAAKTAMGDTHITLTLDMTGLASFDDGPDLPGLATMMHEAVDAGFNVVLMCMGDGNDPGEPGHDGGALGWSWLMANFQAIHDRVGAEGLKPFTLFCPGFDGVVPGWQPYTRVSDFATHARQVVGDGGYLALEQSAGYWCWTGEQDDWGTPFGKLWDTILQEGPIDFIPNGEPDQYWQISKRLLGPKFNRPADMPADDDPGLYHGGPSVHVTPRGPYFVVWFEYDTYLRVRRNALTDAQTAAHRAYIRAMGYDYVC